MDVLRVTYRWPPDLKAMLFGLLSGIAIIWPSAHTRLFEDVLYQFHRYQTLQLYDTQTWMFQAAAIFGLLIFPLATNLLSQSGLSWWFSFPLTLWLAGGIYGLPATWNGPSQAEHMDILFGYWFYALLFNLAIAAAFRRWRRLRYERLLTAQSQSQEAIEGVWPPPPQLK